MIHRPSLPYIVYQNNHISKGPALKIHEFCFDLSTWRLTGVLHLHSSTSYEYIKESTPKYFCSCIQIFLSLFLFSLLNVLKLVYSLVSTSFPHSWKGLECENSTLKGGNGDDMNAPLSLGWMFCQLLPAAEGGPCIPFHVGQPRQRNHSIEAVVTTGPPKAVLEWGLETALTFHWSLARWWSSVRTMYWVCIWLNSFNLKDYLWRVLPSSLFGIKLFFRVWDGGDRISQFGCCFCFDALTWQN